VLVLKSYLDDSGKANDPNEKIICIAGAISPLKAWENLEKEWKSILISFDIPYLHMREYAHSTGPFNKWKGQEEVRQEFLGSLMDTMDRNVMSVIGATVPKDDFNRLTTDQQQKVSDPCFLCFQQTLHSAASTAFAETMTTGMTRRLQVPDPQHVEKIEVIFSRQDEFRSDMNALYDKMRRAARIGAMLGSFSWAFFKDVIPLQVADLIAYEMRIFASELTMPESTTIRVPMKRIFTMNPLFTFFNYNDMVKKFYFGGPAFTD